MTSFAQAVDSLVTKLVAQTKEQLDGVPDEDVNSWKPALGLQDVNTFYALTTHLVSAGEYWILHAAGGRPTNRNRPAEFVATGDVPALLARLDRWSEDVRAMMATFTDEELGRVFERGGDDPVRQTAAECILHALEHTGVHVGHLQLQRQIWNAEKGQR